MRARGNDYIVKDGEMLNFLFKVWFVLKGIIYCSYTVLRR